MHYVKVVFFARVFYPTLKAETVQMKVLDNKPYIDVYKDVIETKDLRTEFRKVLDVVK
jgi:hypothetical protein